jgi:predicted CopG family antitoxin
MKNIEQKSLSELKDLKELLENRTSELRRHQIDGEYFPVYTDKEIQEIEELEKQTNKALSAVSKILRAKVDEFISNINYKE